MKPKPKPVNESKLKKKLEKAIEVKIKEIIRWRDGDTCVMGEDDGARCRGGLCWNHYIRQKRSPILRLDLGNVFWGCDGHNYLDKNGDPCMSNWFAFKFGKDCTNAMREVMIACTGKNYSLAELEAMLEHYEQLYEDRYTINGFGEMVMGGYYGEIIKDILIRDSICAVIKEGDNPGARILIRSKP